MSAASRKKQEMAARMPKQVMYPLSASSAARRLPVAAQVASGTMDSSPRMVATNRSA